MKIYVAALITVGLVLGCRTPDESHVNLDPAPNARIARVGAWRAIVPLLTPRNTVCLGTFISSTTVLTHKRCVTDDRWQVGPTRIGDVSQSATFFASNMTAVLVYQKELADQLQITAFPSIATKQSSEDSNIKVVSLRSSDMEDVKARKPEERRGLLETLAVTDPMGKPLAPADGVVDDVDHKYRVLELKLTFLRAKPGTRGLDEKDMRSVRGFDEEFDMAAPVFEGGSLETPVLTGIVFEHRPANYVLKPDTPATYTDRDRITQYVKAVDLTGPVTQKFFRESVNCAQKVGTPCATIPGY